MRPVSNKWLSTLAKSHRVSCTVKVFWDRGTPDPYKYLLPVIGGSITFDATAVGQRRATVVVPLKDGADDWDPRQSAEHPLSPFGSRLEISLGVVHPDGTKEEVPQGLFQISSSIVDPIAQTVTVQTTDLIQRWIDCRTLNNPYDGWGPEFTYVGVLTLLSYPGLQPLPGVPRITDIDYSAMTNRPLGGPIEVIGAGNQDRMDLLAQLLNAWPAQAGIDDRGYLKVVPPITKPKPLEDLVITTNLPNSTALSLITANQRRRVYNAVYVAGVNPATGNISVRASAEVTSGPMNVNGPMGYLPRWFTSPLIHTQSQANAAAQNLLNKGVLDGLTSDVVCVPNPAIELYDTVLVNDQSHSPLLGLVTAIQIPLTADGGPMQLSVTKSAPES